MFKTFNELLIDQKRNQTTLTRMFELLNRDLIPKTEKVHTLLPLYFSMLVLVEDFHVLHAMYHNLSVERESVDRNRFSSEVLE